MICTFFSIAIFGVAVVLAAKYDISVDWAKSIKFLNLLVLVVFSVSSKIQTLWSKGGLVFTSNLFFLIRFLDLLLRFFTLNGTVAKLGCFKSKAEKFLVYIVTISLASVKCEQNY